jgi:serine/threonine protein kinase
VYEYGGDDLKHMLSHKQTVTLEELFLGCQGIFRGLMQLKKHHKVHQDIKPANILYNAGAKRCYLIDFGLLTETNKIYTKENEFALAYDYDYFPPEYKLYMLCATQYDQKMAPSSTLSITNNVYSSVLLGKPSNLQQETAREFINVIVGNYVMFHERCLKKHLSQLIAKIGGNVGNLLKRFRYWNPERIEDVRNMTTRFLENAGDDLNVVQERLTRVADRIDVYMLGITLLEVFMYLASQGRLQITNDAFLSEYIHLLHGMTRFDPAKRLSPSGAMHMYKRVEGLLDAKRSHTSSHISPSLLKTLHSIPEKPLVPFTLMSIRSLASAPARGGALKAKDAHTRSANRVKQQLSVIRSMRRKKLNDCQTKG